MCHERGRSRVRGEWCSSAAGDWLDAAGRPRVAVREMSAQPIGEHQGRAEPARADAAARSHRIRPIRLKPPRPAEQACGTTQPPTNTSTTEPRRATLATRSSLRSTQARYSRRTSTSHSDHDHPIWEQQPPSPPKRSPSRPNPRPRTTSADMRDVSGAGDIKVRCSLRRRSERTRRWV